MKRVAVIVLLLIALTGVAFLGYLLLFAFSVPSSQDHDRVTSFVHELEREYPFRVQRQDGEGAAIYVGPMPQEDQIFIYGEYSGAEIIGIEAAARRIQAARTEARKVTLNFYKTELENRTAYKKIVIP